jgi:hypothetical protein
MKKLSLLVLLISLLCLVGLFCACDTGEVVQANPCADGHTETIDASVAATCTETGLSMGSHCSVCNLVLTEQKSVPVVAHTPGEWTDQVASTCTEKGVRQKSCTVCSTVLQTEVTTAGAHDFTEWATTLKATCTQEGEQTRSCNLCQAVETRAVKKAAHLSGPTIIDIEASCQSPGKKHTECTKCNAVITQATIPATEHAYGDWSITLAASCS